ncbi:SEP domain containing protein [Lactarius tabidus]
MGVACGPICLNLRYRCCFATLGDDSDDGDDDEPQNYFAGGERRGPPDISGGRGLMRDLLTRALNDRSVETEPQDVQKSNVFSGGGYTLGSDEVESTYVPDPSRPANPLLFTPLPVFPPLMGSRHQQTDMRDLTFWRDGFSVEGGERRRYDDLAQAQILSEVNAGRAPPSILIAQPGQPVDHQGHVPTPRRGFAGSGSRLGATSRKVRSLPSFGTPPSTSVAPAPAPAAASRTRDPETSKPTTSVQVGLADGTRIVARMNLDHTVRGLHSFINASRPEYSTRALDDNSLTIEAADLMNGVMVPRWV